MKTGLLNILVLVTGLVISCVAAWYSITGLAAIFSGAFWPIIIMGSALEIGKLVSVSWLYNNWMYAPRFLKIYLSISAIILMLITSMGIFGFLSKAHIEQQLILNTGVSDQIEIIDSQIEFKQNEIKDIDTQISVIDNSINKMIEKGQAKSSLNAANQQKKNRNDLIAQKKNLVKELGELKTQKIKYGSEYKKMEAEVGPIKYVAELIYGSSNQEILDKAVRSVIIILIFVFDPLAVLLLLAFNISITRKDYEEMEFLDLRKFKTEDDHDKRNS